MKKLIIAIVMLLATFIVVASPQGVPTLTIAVVSSTPSLILAQNLNRGSLLIQNESGGNCYFSFAPFTGTNALLILTGQNYDSQEAYIKSAVYASCSPGSSLVLLEANY